MIYPRLVFRCPGPVQRPGGSYAHLAVQSDDDLAKRLAEGWFETLPAAIDGVKPTVLMAVVPPDDAAPTRAELEAKGTELGLKFDGRTTDAKLGRMIEEAIAGHGDEDRL